MTSSSSSDLPRKFNFEVAGNDAVDDNGDDDDDSSWESINSELEDRYNLLDEKTRQIVSFFVKDYKVLNETSEAYYFLRNRDGDY
jgi:hypothetical protein